MWRFKKDWSLESSIAYICGGLVIAAGVGACLLRGLFFTDEMYPFLTLWFVLCCACSLYILVGVGIWRRSGGGVGAGAVRGFTGVNGVSKVSEVSQVSGENRALRILLSVPLIILSLYVIHWLCGPLSSQGTMNEMLRWGLYASFAILVCFCAVNLVGRRILNVIWSMLGMTLCLSALLAVCGVVKLPFAVAYSNSAEVSATGVRLAGLMEYPNAFGAVMAVFLLERLFAVAVYYGDPKKSTNMLGARSVGLGMECADAERRSRGEEGVEAEQGKAGSTTAALLRLLPLFPYTAALLLTESRGAWLTAACACAAVLLWKRQLIAPLLAAGAAPVAAAALLYRQLARAGLAVEPVPGLLLLAGHWAGALLAGLWLCRRQRGAAGTARAAMLALAAAGWTAAGIAVLLHVRERITGPSSTVSARGLFYRDAWRLAVEAPWLGRGGETWRHSYLAAQSRPYVGSQVHNGYLDILLNLGFVGLAAILLMLLAAGWLLATKSPRLLPPFLVIVLHSVVDFDWSYGLFWLLLFWLPAIALAEHKQKHQSASTHPQSETKLPTHSTSTNPLTNVTTPANPLIAHSTSTNPLTNVTTPANPLIVHSTSTNRLTNVSTPANPLIAHSTSTNPLTNVTTPANPLIAHSTSTNPLTNVSTPANPLIAHSTPKKPPQIRLRRLIGTAACCFSLMLGVLSFHAAQGEKFYRQAIMSVDPSVKVELLQQSLGWNPRSPRTAIALSRLLSGEQSVSLLRQSLLYSPENASLSWELAERWMSSDHPGAALYWIGQSLRLDKYNNAKWVKAIEGMLLMGQKKLAEGKRKEGLVCVASGNELLLEYRKLAEEEANKGGQHNDREFQMTEQADDLSRRLSMLALRF
ncbi:O-antigen ligase family protein [Paenibacillus odorifer]|uniref:O-antigen ligase family protein n=1 Tax=Paenibacillus odorifer TaxID=189426 RepID=UPI00068E6B1E|nr:O-antigen ligase family protein [Paenibacillus odorifer]